jgi:hypothetical protein
VSLEISDGRSEVLEETKSKELVFGWCRSIKNKGESEESGYRFGFSSPTTLVEGAFSVARSKMALCSMFVFVTGVDSANGVTCERALATESIDTRRGINAGKSSKVFRCPEEYWNIIDEHGDGISIKMSP